MSVNASLPTFTDQDHRVCDEVNQMRCDALAALRDATTNEIEFTWSAAGNQVSSSLTDCSFRSLELQRRRCPVVTPAPTWRRIDAASEAAASLAPLVPMYPYERSGWDEELRAIPARPCLRIRRHRLIQRPHRGRAVWAQGPAISPARGCLRRVAPCGESVFALDHLKYRRHVRHLVAVASDVLKESTT